MRKKHAGTVRGARFSESLACLETGSIDQIEL
jgi:hypothetical protein